ncbi:MAG: hypothetical protein IKZ88_01765 [Neisseriaceae bacterium]|nr:hypothetical protein [Neisseriaceae bacterium]
MSDIFYLNDYAYFSCSQKTDNSELKKLLKQQFNIDARRISRLTMASLLSVLPVNIQNKNTYLYVGTAFSSPEKFNQQMDRLLNKEMPKPFDFIYNIANAPAFEMAKIRSLQGNALNCAVPYDEYTAWQQLLTMAVSDLLQGHTQNALICLAYEYINGDCKAQSLLLSKNDNPQKKADVYFTQNNNKTECSGSLIELLQQKQNIILPINKQYQIEFNL